MSQYFESIVIEDSTNGIIGAKTVGIYSKKPISDLKGERVLKNKLAFSALIITGMIFLLYLMNSTYYKVRETESPSTYIWMSALVFLFGALIEWKALCNVLKGDITVNWQLLIPAIILAALTFIPSMYWGLWFGFGRLFYIDMLWKPEIKVLLTAFSGILFIRSLGGKE